MIVPSLSDVSYFYYMIGNKKDIFWKSTLEVGFIIFLFYSNLLMGEYNKTGLAQKNGLWWAINDIFTPENFAIAVVMASLTHFFFDFLCRKL